MGAEAEKDQGEAEPQVPLPITVPNPNPNSITGAQFVAWKRRKVISMSLSLSVLDFC